MTNERKGLLGGRLPRILAACVPALALATGLVLSRNGAAKAGADDAVPDVIDFNRDVRPILNTSCIKCHGGVKEAGGVSFQFPETILVKGKSGKQPVSPGHPEMSEMIRRITASKDDGLMPLGGPPLSARDTAILQKWVKQGAPWGVHWAFTPPQNPALPEVKDTSWVRGPIDRFILARLEKENLKPSPEADRHTLIRRASLDIIGLPPTAEETNAFVNDPSPDAYEKLVDRLLASPHYGERMAAAWMDLARYGDSTGYERDHNLPRWPYRDWLIAAFNADMPYDRFTVSQVAGDLLANKTAADTVASAFNRLTLINSEDGSDPQEYRDYAVMDRLTTTMTVWMGVTIGCVQCHGHPYDPIRHEEFYRSMAFFNNTQDVNSAAPIIRVNAEYAKKFIAEIGAKNMSYAPEMKREVSLPVMVELAPEKSRKTHVFTRGNRNAPGALVEPKTPEIFGPFPAEAPKTRLGFSEWLVSKTNPLTARVQVSRLWEQLFGLGLEPTLEDFGSLGEKPEHLELLDHLAIRLRDDNAWSLKKTLREILLSATYRQTSKNTPEMADRDPRNLLYSRQTRIRLSAEAIRDQALSISGLLSRKIGGPSVMPVQPAGFWQVPYNGEVWTNATGEDAYRRAIYTFWKRSNPYPSLLTFDSVDRNTCSARRQNSNSPLQAFVTLNDPAYVECAKAFASLMEKDAKTPKDAIDAGLARATCKPADPKTVETLLALHTKLAAHYAKDPESAKKVGGDANHAALVGVASVILNLDSVLNKS